MDGYYFFRTQQLAGLVLSLLLLLSAGSVTAIESCAALNLNGKDAFSGAGVEKGAPSYVHINHILQLTNDVERRSALREQIASLQSAHVVETQALIPRLQIALAHSELRLGNPDEAMNVLRKVPLGSTQTAAALLLMGEVAHSTDSLEKANAWIQHAAQLYPYQPETIEGLLRASQWQTDLEEALPLLIQARSLADSQLYAISKIVNQSNSATFIQSLGLAKPNADIWSLTNEALTDPAFAIAFMDHQKSLSFRNCLKEHMERLANHRVNNPSLVRDLGQTLQQLDALLPIARASLSLAEGSYMESAQYLKHCAPNTNLCSAHKLQQKIRGQKLTQMRNSVRLMEQQRSFLLSEQNKLHERIRNEQRDMAAIGLALLQKDSESQRVMVELLQRALEKSYVRWRELSARAHFELASTQDKLIKQSAKH
ncbi:MAG: hypothetical protein IT466_10345 [Moraxellaceae bacterium]|nr:hypothetical protein [Moraxellaceae bacterium]HQV41446.1 hypothetical protein [Moraxellaceae bacterium]HQX89542.1 hypothetical protein [Moraxellaceae bacterium]